MVSNWDFATNFDFLITIFLQPDVADLLIFQNLNSVWSKSLEYLRCTPLGCKDKAIEKFEFEQISAVSLNWKSDMKELLIFWK